MARSVVIRAARRVDAEAIRSIYNEGIAGRQATFETTPRAEENVRAWLDSELPFLVAEIPGEKVVGWARVSVYSDRCVYEGIGEHGFYVAREAQGRGLGRLLLDALATAAEEAGYYKLRAWRFTARPDSRKWASRRGTAASTASGRYCVLVERLLGPALFIDEERR